MKRFHSRNLEAAKLTGPHQMLGNSGLSHAEGEIYLPPGTNLEDAHRGEWQFAHATKI